MKTILLKIAQRIWHGLLPKAFKKKLRGFAERRLLRNCLKILSRKPNATQSGHLILTGFTTEHSGLGIATKATIKTLELKSISANIADVRELLASRNIGSADLDPEDVGGVWILHCNAPEAVKAISVLKPEQWISRFRIAYWAFELPTLPEYWVEASKLFDEIWVPSKFIADACIASGIDTPVKVLDLLISDEEIDPNLAIKFRTEQGVSADTCIIAAMGDVLSSPTRKNLMGSVSIFKTIFPVETESAVLYLKVSNACSNPQFLAQLQEEIQGRPDIQLVTETFTEAKMQGFIGAWDVYLSPHRSEGYGIGIAEAMMARKAVLATSWSGNMQFMDGMPKESLIGFELIPVCDPWGVYRASNGEVWAEPNLKDAALKLKALVTDQRLRQEIGNIGRLEILNRNRVVKTEAMFSSRASKFLSRGETR